MRRWNLPVSDNLLLFCCIMLMLVTLYALFVTPIFGDEATSHFPLSQTINLKMIIDVHSAYPSAYTPLSYCIARPLYELIPTIYTVRLLNWFVAIAAAILFLLLVRKLTDQWRAVFLLFLANPYFLRAAVVLYILNWGLLFGLAALYVYFYVKKPYAYALSHLLLLLAVLSVQWMLMLYVAFFLYELKQVSLHTWRDLRLLVRPVTAKIVSLVPLFMLAFFWRGLTHPNAYRSLVPTIANVNIVMAIMGFLFVLWLMMNWRRPAWSDALIVFFTLPILYFGQPVHAIQQGIGLYTGLESTILHKLEMFTHFPYSWSLFILTAAGLLFFIRVVRARQEGLSLVALYLVFALMVSYVLQSLLSSTHVYGMLPFLLLSSIPVFKEQNRGLLLVVLQWLLLAVVYILYYAHVKTHGILL